MPRAEKPTLIIHAGFHKTGTSSVQRGLDQSRDALFPWRILLKQDMPDTCKAARNYARNPDERARAIFKTSVRDNIAQATPQPTIISAEDLAGLIPGRRQRRGYPVASILLRTLVAALPEYAPQIHFSTRSAAAWLQSCHAHHLRHTRLCADLAAYSAAQTGASDLDQISRDIAVSLAPVPISFATLDETAQLPYGPLTPFLDMMAVDQDTRNRLHPVPVANLSLPDHILDGLRELNHSDLDPAQLATHKQTLIADYRRTHQCP